MWQQLPAYCHASIIIGYDIEEYENEFPLQCHVVCTSYSKN
jgi:hypothetical protein